MNKLIRYFQTSLQRRLAIVITAMIVIPLVIVALFLGSRLSLSLTEDLTKLEESSITDSAASMRDFFSVVNGDLEFIANSPDVLELADGLVNNRPELIDVAVDHNQELFLSLAVSRQLYRNIRFLDVTGQELIRVDFNEDTPPTIIPKNELQDKSDRDFFIEAVGLPEGSTYVSRLDLNREGTPPQIILNAEGKPIPVIRYGKPIYATNETTGTRQLSGVIIFNVYAQGIFNRLELPENSDVHLIDSQGYFLFNTDNVEGTFGFEPDAESVGFIQGFSTKDEFPDAVTQLANPYDTVAQVSSAKNSTTYRLFYTRFVPEGAPPGYYWTIATAFDENILFVPIRTFTLGVAASVVLAIIAISVFIPYFTSQLTSPILDISKQVSRLASGDLTAQIQGDSINRLDEVGLLSRAFNEMSIQLKELLGTLEDRVTTRTADLATSAEIASAANQTRDINDLISLAVNLIRDRFDFYYVQLYLLDDHQEFAILRDGTGYVGHRLLGQNHQLPLNGRSLVATAVQTQKEIVVQDTRTSSTYLQNPLLPDTRAELVMPLIVNNKVIGVLDIQHNQPNAFEEAEQKLFKTLGDQIAIAINNATTFDTMENTRSLLQENAARLNAVTSNFPNGMVAMFDREYRYLFADGRGWDLAGIDKNTLVGKNIRDIFPSNLSDRMRSLYERVFNGEENVMDETLLGNLTFEYISSPIRNEANEIVAGISIATNVTERKRLETIQAIQYEIANKLNKATNTQEILESLVDYAKDHGAVSANAFYIDSDENGNAIWAITKGSWALEGYTPLPINEKYYLPDLALSKNWTSDPDNLVLMENTQTDERVDEGSREIYAYFGIYGSTILPIHTNDRWVGLIIFNWDKAHTFSQEEKSIYEIVMKQIVSALDNVRISEVMRKRALEFATVAEVSAQASTNLDIPNLLKSVSDLTKEQFGLYHAHIYLLDLNERMLVLGGGAGVAGIEMLARKQRIPLSKEHSLVARAARTRESVISNDVTQEPDFLPNDLLPDTKSELAIPMMVGDELIGVLDVQSVYTNRFTSEDVTIKTTLASQIAVAVKNARLFKEVNDIRFAVDQHSIVAITDATGKIIYSNEKLSEISKYPIEELLGQDHRMLNSAYHSKEFIRDLWVTIANGKVWRGQLRNVAKDGSYYWVDTTIVPFLNDEGKPYQYIALRNDITAEKAKEEQINARMQELESVSQITRKRAVELATVAEVSAQASTNLDIPNLLRSVSDLTKEQFGLYHAHIYLLDLNERMLVLGGGAGVAGMEMLSRKQRIPLSKEHSLVARAARTRESVISNDITQEPDFLPNDLLPDTKSELAIPMIVGDELIGVLDVQSVHTNRFTSEDVTIKTTLASQIAVAVKNARLFKEVNDIRFAVDQHSIVAITDATGKIIYSNDKLSEISKYSMEELLGQDHRILNSAYHSKEFIRDLWVTIANGQVWHGKLRNKAKDGSYYWVETTIVPFLNDEGKPYQYIALRNDITAEKANEEQINRRAKELETVSRISASIATQLNVQELLWTVADLTKEEFERYHAHIYLVDDMRENLILAAGAGQIGRRMVSEGYKISINHPASLVARAAREHKGIVINDVMSEPQFLPNKYLPDTLSEMAVPILYGDILLGVLDIQDNITYAFSDLEVQVKITFANQIAVAIENARQFEQTQLLLRDITTNNRIGEMVREDDTMDIMLENILQIVYDTLLPTNMLLSRYDAATHKWYGQVAVGQNMDTDFARSVVDEDKTYPHGLIALETRRVVAVGNTRHYPNFPEYYIETLGLKSVLVLPLYTNNQPYGVVFLNYNDAYQNFSDDLIQLAENVAGQISLGIERKLAEQHAQEQQEEQTVLFDTSRLLVDAQNIDQIFDAINLYAAKNGADTASLFYYNTQEDMSDPDYGYAVASWNYVKTPNPIPVGAGFYLPDFKITSYWFANPNNVVFIESLEDEAVDPNTRVLFENVGVQASLFMPLHTQGQWIGLVWLGWSSPRTFSAFEKRIYNAIMRQSVSSVRALRSAEETRLAGFRAFILSEVTAGLSEANDEASILNSMARYLATLNPSDVSLVYINSDDTGKPSTQYTVAHWIEGHTLTNGKDLNKNILIDDFDLSPLWVNQPNALIAISDVHSDERTAFLGAQNTSIYGKSLAILPLRNAGITHGLLLVSWQELHQFNETEIYILERLIQPLSAVIANRRGSLIIQKRATEMETVALVSATTTSLLDLDALLESVVELSKESFNLYHTHIYLYDEDKGEMILAAGAGEAGALMKAKKHHIPLTRENSLVVRAAMTRQVVVSNNVMDDEHFLPNPLLPDTQSEMSIPMIVGDDLIGVLDIQHTELDYFTETDKLLQTTLADQIAVAVRNAQAFDRERKTIERLREVDRLKQEFLANMSHELRTPLNSIIGYSEVLIDGVDGELSDEAVEDVEAIHNSGKHLLNIINEILDLAKIEAGQMQLTVKPLNVVDVLNEVVRNTQILVKDKDVDLIVEEVSPVGMVNGDKIRLYQIMLNLISNAVKFTEKGTITVRYGMSEDYVRVEVQDTGFGMKPNDLEVIFERFRQADGSSTRKAGGTGLGLTITRQLINMHGGEIYVESAIGEGSLFWFTIPVIANTVPSLEQELQAGD